MRSFKRIANPIANRRIVIASSAIAFVGMMTLSAGLAHMGVILPWVEQSIILSDIVLGLLIFYSAQLPVNVGIALAGILAIAHGHAHGTEIPMGASALDIEQLKTFNRTTFQNNVSKSG
jgi:hydrogenase/urease accessory protein HupE